MELPGKRLRLGDGAASLSLLPGLADNTFGYNATSYNESVVTDGTSRYATWVDSARHPIVGKRTLPTGAWTTFDLTTVGGLIGATVAADGHNVVNVGVDADGYIHVSGNMHGDWLRYARSDTPGALAFTNQDMLHSGTKTGTDEGLVSYPRFINNPATGDLLFMYRNGASGSGGLYLNQYDTATQTWSRVALLIDGAATGHSAYENTPVIDAAGVMHLSWSWAASGSGFNDRHDVCYMRSHDNGATWETIDGAPVALPVTYGASAPTVLDTVDSNNGMLNTSGMDVDDQGRPHVALLYADDDNRNIFHLWHDGTAWRLDKITGFTESGLEWETLPSRPDMICWQGRSFICWRYQYEGRRGQVWLSEVTGSTPVHFPILDGDLYDWEPTHDPAALSGRDELVMLVSRVNWDDGTNVTPRSHYGQESWDAQKIGVLSVDMTKIDRLRDGLSALPRMPR